MIYYPDLDSFMIYPWKQEHGKVARLICDVHKTDGAPFEGDPRSILRRILAEAAKMGFTFNVGRSANSSCSRLTMRGIPRPPLSTTEAILSWALDRGKTPGGIFA